MQYRMLGKTGLEVSLLGFGFMRLPCHSNTIDGKSIKEVDFEQTEILFNKALELGINYFDTASIYHGGQSEKILGDLIAKKQNRKDLIIATKMPCSRITATEHFEKFFAQQLEALQTDYIDVYLMHSLNKTRWEFMKKLGALEFLEQKKKEGSIKHIGFSFHDAYDILVEIVEEYPAFEVAQIQLNYIDTEIQAGIKGYNYLVEKGLGVLIVEPLKGGTLAQNIPQEIKEIWDSAEIKRSPAEWGMRWIFDKEDVACALSGMNTVEQLEENVRIADIHVVNSLTEKDRTLYRKSRKKLLELAPIHCTACKYCMPCGHSVDIPNIFSLYNQLVMFKNKNWVAKQYATALLNKEGATHCRACKKCSRKCPQGIDVPTQLHRVHDILTALIEEEKIKQ